MALLRLGSLWVLPQPPLPMGLPLPLLLVCTAFGSCISKRAGGSLSFARLLEGRSAHRDQINQSWSQGWQGHVSA